MTDPAPLRFAAFLLLAAVGLIVHAAAEARRDRIARGKAQGKRIVRRAEVEGRTAGVTR